MVLYHEAGVVKVENVAICRGIFQGDALSPLLFILAINPLSLLINRRCVGYCLNKIYISHILYMDDIKTFSNSFENLKKMAQLTEKFSTDIGMELGQASVRWLTWLLGDTSSVVMIGWRVGE